MHIPDGYLSPSTCAVGFALAVPAWAVASQRVKKQVKTRNVPTLAVLSAVCFLVMMFNIPIPDGTTAHAVGGSLVAIVLGPWAAVIAVTVALLFQALLFGDGGVLAFGFNVVNMAVVLPFVGVGVYRLIAGRSPLTSARRVVAAVIGGFVGLNAAALCVGIELGVQPLLFKSSSGVPLYSPYNLAEAVPAMMFAHVTVAGWAEAILTGGVFAYLQRANLPLLRANNPDAPVSEETARKRQVRPVLAAVVAMGVMLVATPLGLLATGTAFGEAAPQELTEKAAGLAVVPEGLATYSGFWGHALFPDYGFGGNEVLGYYMSALIGVAVVGAATFLLAFFLRRVFASGGGTGSDAGGGSDGGGGSGGAPRDGETSRIAEGGTGRATPEGSS